MTNGECLAGASSGRGNLLRAAAEPNELAVVQTIAAALGRRAEQSSEARRRRSQLTLASRVVQAPRPGRATAGRCTPRAAAVSREPCSFAGVQAELDRK